MDTDLKCNHLSCRKPLIDKAVVTTCSHIFCVECANELFNASRICPACESSLTEPDDVVVCSLHPTDDYKTSVLSGLSPSIIMEICSRALSFWQYQVHQESSFQQAVSRNLNDRNAQLQKQLENVIREANGEIRLLGDKMTELERDLELERRKVRELQDTSREREKEYQRLKAQLDKVKRKALLGPDTATRAIAPAADPHNRTPLDNTSVQRQPLGGVGTVVGGMEANGIQRTPLNNRNVPMNFGGQPAYSWLSSRARVPPLSGPQRLNPADRSLRANSISDQSESANEVENFLLPNHNRGRPGLAPGSNGWNASSGRVQPVQQRPFNPAAKRGFTR
ncbi:hypothetical protein EDC04DRAFT_585983 [Pisolithus marmoratus]|nr:hypothetical protein EDC04DRAFT_585983 [Pisolithus marmoratus]